MYTEQQIIMAMGYVAAGEECQDIEEELQRVAMHPLFAAQLIEALEQVKLLG